MQAKKPVTPPVTKPVTRPVTSGSHLAMPVTPAVTPEPLHWCERCEVLLTALRRIRSLDPKNVERYAQEIASEALMRERPTTSAERMRRLRAKLKS